MSDVSRVEELFLNAVGQGPAERMAYLDAQCGGDDDLRRRVEVLLEAQPNVGGFLEPHVDLTGAYQPKPMTPEPTSAVGDRIGPYKLLEKIGEGGMGEVWVADQLEPIKRRVALKLIKPGMDSRSVLGRFEAERQALAVMDHPNIAKVLDAGTTTDGRPYFVMELVKGTPITEFADARKLTPKQRLELFVPVCQAIQHAHMKGIIHRDIKPSNVLVELHDDRSVVKVIDFGVAKAIGQQFTEKTIYTGFGALVGTPAYMAPEQASFNALDVDTRADVYALGVLLYELLAGSPPIEKERLKKAALDEVLRIVRDEEPPRPSARLSTSQAKASIAATRGSEPAKLSQLMKGEIDWIVMKALEKDRARRYETANGFAADVQRYLCGEQVQAVPPSLGYRLRKFTKRHKARIASGVFVGLALLVGVAGTIWQAAERRHERQVVKLQSLQATTSALDRAEAALVANRLSEVDAALALVDPETFGDTSELAARIETIRKDRDTLRELETIYEEYWTVCPSSMTRDPERAKIRYPDLFRRYGIPVGELSATVAMDRVKSSLIAPALTDGLATWFFLDPKVEGLRPLLDSLDPDEFRVKVRAAVANENKEKLRELAAKVDPTQHPPVFSVMLASAGVDAENYRILQAAWRSYPDSFAVVLALAFPEVGADEARAKERLGWCRTAISLRPNNALAYFYFSLQFRNDETAQGLTTRIAALRRAVELAPRFVDAHAQLGKALLEAKLEDEALSSFIRTTDLDPNNLSGHAGQCLVSIRRKDWIGFSKAYRRISPLLDPDDPFCIAHSLSDELNIVIHFNIGRIIQDMSKGMFYYAMVEFCDGETRPWFYETDTVESDNDKIVLRRFLPSCAAVQAAAGRGMDPPPTADRPRVRRLAVEWLTADLEACELKLCEDEKLRPAVHAMMKKWLDEPMLADVRGARIADLPKDEQDEWKMLWTNVEKLRDETIPPPRELAPMPREK